MGTGTEELVNQCIEKGLKKPVFIQENDFMTILYRSVTNENRQSAEKGTEKSGEKITENQRLLIDSIEKNPYITIEELTLIVGIAASKIKENI
jgi:predicted HTH transcriptional regulator